MLLLLLTFSAFCMQNVEKAYVNQRLECEAPKGWLKYTTNNHFLLEMGSRMMVESMGQLPTYVAPPKSSRY